MPNLSDLFSAGGFLKWDGAGNTDADYASNTAAELAADAAFTGAFAPVAAPSVIIFGTSITSQNGTGTNTLDPALGPDAVNSRGYWSWAAMYLHQRLTFVRNAGVSGNRSDQMLARLDADVLAYDADWVVVEPYPNDIANDIASATTIANVDAICDAITGDGRRVLLLTPNPSTSYNTAGRKAAFSDCYAHALAMPLNNPKVVVADTWRVLVDPATGYPATGMSLDGIHLSEMGAARMGKVIANVLSEVVPPRPPRMLTLADPKNVIDNPALTSGTGWTATGTGATATYSATALGDRWTTEATITLAAVADDSERFIQSISNISGGRYQAGDVIQGSVRLVWNLVPRASDAFRPFFRIWPRLSSGTFGTAVYGAAVATAEELTLAGVPTTGDIVVLTPKVTIPATTDRLYVAIGWQGAESGTVKISDLAVWKT